MEAGGAAAARSSIPRANSSPMLLHGAEEAQRVEDLEYLLGDVLGTLSRLEAKRGSLERSISAASRGRHAHHGRRAPAAVDGGGDKLVAPVPAYTRKGAGSVRKRLRAAAGDAKKEFQRLEALWGDLEEALVSAKERVALPRGTA